MSEIGDFEQAWLAKFAQAMNELVSENATEEILRGSEGLSSSSPRQEVIAWTRQALARLEALADEETGRQVLLRCACRYPRADLQEIRAAYQASRDLGLAHRMLQAQFESFLRVTLGLDETLVREVIGRGWGSAGIRQGRTIIATKIPKSGSLAAYLEEPDPDKRRQSYCHCPRVWDVLLLGGSLSPTYCYCGAGFYKDIWEEIVQRPVRVEVLETVLQGGDVCRFAVHLDNQK